MIALNKYLYHKSNPEFRDSILKDGLLPMIGDSYKGYGLDGRQPIPAIFVVNFENRDFYSTTYDDDIWEIDSTKISNTWEKDPNMSGLSFDSEKYLVTFTKIPKEAIKLVYKGSGKDLL